MRYSCLPLQHFYCRWISNIHAWQSELITSWHANRKRTWISRSTATPLARKQRSNYSIRPVVVWIASKTARFRNRVSEDKFNTSQERKGFKHLMTRIKFSGLHQCANVTICVCWLQCRNFMRVTVIAVLYIDLGRSENGNSAHNNLPVAIIRCYW